MNEAKGMTEEEWRPVKGYEGKYEVNRKGEIKKVDTLIGQWKSSHGYSNAKFSTPRKDMRVHRVVAQAFIPNPKNLPFINHINHIRDDNRVENLEWCNQKQNLEHMTKAGRRANFWKGKRSPSAKLTDSQVKKIKSEYAGGQISFERLGVKYNTSKRTIGRIISGVSYV